MMDLMEDGLQLRTNMGEEFVDQYDYQRLVGSFIFLSHIHLEISFVVNCVSIYIYSSKNTYRWSKTDYALHMKDGWIWYDLSA